MPRPDQNRPQSGSPRISVVIPMYNAGGTIGKCLDSLLASPCREQLEIIVVNDHSTDGCEKIVEGYPCTLVNLDSGRNVGAGEARNTGARRARGELLYFVDADIIQLDDTLPNIVRAFAEDPGLEILAGIYSKHPANSGFGADFVALKTFHFASRGPARKEISFVQSGCFAIRRSVFEATGGFSGVRWAEEYEYGHRLSRTHQIIMDKTVVVIHHHPHVVERLEEITRRTYHWFPLFLSRRRFETEGGTGSPQEAVSAVLVFSSFLCLVLALGLAPVAPGPAVRVLAAGALLLAAVLAVNLGLYRFFARERSWGFALRAILTDLLHYIGVGCGASAAFAVWCWRALTRRGRTAGSATARSAISPRR